MDTYADLMLRSACKARLEAWLRTQTLPLLVSAAMRGHASRRALRALLSMRAARATHAGQIISSVLSSVSP